MRLAIVGSRDFPDLEMVRDYIRTLHPTVDIISGGARGVDAVAVDEARKLKMRWKEFKPVGNLADPRVYHERNDLIVAHCDALVAFWDGESRGTESTIRKAETARKLLHVFTLQKEPESREL